MAEKICPACDKALPPDAHPRRKYCDSACRKTFTRRRKRWLYRNDPEYREHHKAYKRQLLIDNPEYRQRKNKQNRDRYAASPELRELVRERSREYYKQNSKRLKKAARIRHRSKRSIKEWQEKSGARKLKFVFKPREST